MIIAPHAAIGFLTFKVFDRMFEHKLQTSPLLCSFVMYLAFFSHFLLDGIPHTEYSFARPHLTFGLLEMLVDAALSILFLSLSTNSYPTWNNIKKDWGMYLAGFIAVAPDVVTNLDRIFGLNLWFTNFHDQFHTAVIPTFWVGVLTQVITVSVAGILLKLLSKDLRQPRFVS